MEWTHHRIRELACRLAGKPMVKGQRLPNGVPEALAEALAVSITTARNYLCGVKVPSRQVCKMLDMLEKWGERT